MAEIILNSDFRISNVENIKNELISIVDRPAIVIDGSGIEKIDSTGVQLLVAFIAALKNAGSTYQWKGRSAELESALSILGLYDQVS